MAFFGVASASCWTGQPDRGYRVPHGAHNGGELKESSDMMDWEEHIAVMRLRYWIQIDGF
jgi:hypothetical protein